MGRGSERRSCHWWGMHAGLLFRTRKIWMSRDLWGFSFPVLVKFQSVERKPAASFYLVDMNYICPKKEARCKTGLLWNCGWALVQMGLKSCLVWAGGPEKWPSPLQHQFAPQGQRVFSFTSVLLTAFSFLFSWACLLSPLVHLFLVNSVATTKSDDFFELEVPHPHDRVIASKRSSK